MLKTKKRKIIVWSSIIVVLVVSFVVLTVFIAEFFISLNKKSQRNYIEMISNRWDISLPKDMDVKFHDRDDSWYGDGVAYAFFTLKEPPEELIADFSNERNKEFEKEVTNHLFNATFTIKEKYLPVWREDYVWKRIDEDIDRETSDLRERHCYMIYFPNTLELAICQYFN